VVVALGASAARSVIGRAVTIAKMRGAAHAVADGTRTVVTIHPSWLLRMESEDQRRAEYARFVSDLGLPARSIRH
jgi:DNA polymerase